MARLTLTGGRAVAVMPTAVAWVGPYLDHSIRDDLLEVHLLVPSSTWDEDQFVTTHATLYTDMTLDDVVAELDAALRRETKDG